MASAAPLFTPIRIGPRTAGNRIVLNAMECNDADKQGNPSELTCRRYRRCLEGNPGVIDVEAISVLEDSRGRLNQLIGSRANLPALKTFIAEMRKVNDKPLLLIQLTHSGERVELQGRSWVFPDGSCLESAFVSYDTAYPRSGWHEQRPEDWWKAVVESTRQLLSRRSGEAGSVECISISGHSLGAVPLDAGSLGAAALGAVGCGLWRDFGRIDQVHQVQACYGPIPEDARRYRALRPAFEALRSSQAARADDEQEAPT